MQFDVFDSGLGMDEQQAVRLFKEFSQADNSVTRRFGGTGLGLSISRRLARMLGGDVTLVESAPGRGSHFRAEVAAINAIESAPAPANLNGSPARSKVLGSKELHGMRILLAEDGLDNQKLISFHLARAGADVIIAENGKLAVDAVRTAIANDERFDVILMDMQMPVMSGFEAAGTLRQSGCETPIIALTANAMSGDRNKCIKAGCNEYATKPINRDALIGLIVRCAGLLQA
jgi:CheY-like chemotaxis protein